MVRAEEEKKEELKLRGEINLFRYVPLFMKEFVLEIEKREGEKIILKKEDGHSYTLIKLPSFPWWFFVPNFFFLSIVTAVMLLSISKTKALIELVTGMAIGMGMALSLMNMDRIDRFIRNRLGGVVPLFRVDVIATPLLVFSLLALYGVVFVGAFSFDLSQDWVSFSMEFFIDTVLLYPLFHYWRNRNRLFLIAEEEGFIVIARSVLRRKRNGEG